MRGRDREGGTTATQLIVIAPGVRTVARFSGLTFHGGQLPMV
jgi:hypothetical protein